MGLGPKPLETAVDVTVASVARMYDFLLRGRDNYPADRVACAALSEVVPNAATLAKDQRAFSLAAVDRLASRYGVRQFIDFGCGMPTWAKTHKVAQRIDDTSRVVYVDKDPMVVAHGRALLDEEGSTAVLQGDLLEGDRLLTRPQITDLIELDQPVAITMTSVLHCVPDDDQPALALRSLLSALPSGSFLVLSQWTSEDSRICDRVARLMDRSTAGAWGQIRTPTEIDTFFEGMSLEEPGLGNVAAWGRIERTHGLPDVVYEYGGVARIQL